MSFELKFLDTPVPKEFLRSEEQAVYASIKIGDFRERIIVPTNFWSLADYTHQWVEALELLISNDYAIAAIITEMYDPDDRSYPILWWPLYRDRDLVYIRSQYIPAKEFAAPFDLEEAYSHIEKRKKVGGQYRVSEWACSITDLKAFLRELKQEI